MRKDGSEIPIEIGLNPLVIEDSRFVLASIIDITERLNADRLQRSLQAGMLRQSILYSMPFSVIPTDTAGQLVANTPAPAQMLGPPPKPLEIGRPSVWGTGSHYRYNAWGGRHLHTKITNK